MRESTSPKTTRDAILDATDRLLAKNGYKKMTIDDLAAEVGIGKGSVYLHFASKQEIALSHVDRIVERLISKLEQIASAKGDRRNKLRRMLVERVVFRFDSVQHYSQSLNELLAELRPQLLERRKRHFEMEAGVLSRIISDGIEIGEFTKVDASNTAFRMIDATNSLLPYSLSVHELGERAEIVRKAGQIADLLLFGISNSSTEENS